MYFEETILKHIDEGDILKLMADTIGVVRESLFDGTSAYKLAKETEDKLNYLQHNYKLKRKTTDI